MQFPTMDEALTVMRDHPDGIQLSDGVRASVLAVWLRREPLNDKYLRALFPQDDDHSKKCEATELSKSRRLYFALFQVLC